MRASTARLMNSPVRLADLTFPQLSRLVHRTRLAFIHLDNLLAFAKRDRDGRVDGYITAHLPDECLLLLFRKGEAMSAASAETRNIDPREPGAFFPAFAQERTTGVLELISNGRVSYLRFDEGRFAGGYFCDKPDTLMVPKFLEAQFAADADGQLPALTATLFPRVCELPQQAPNALINTYRELYWRIVDEVDKEFPGEARRRAQKVSTGIREAHKAITILAAPRGAEIPDAVVQPEELSNALSDWSLQLLEGVEVMMPGTAPKILREATREHRYVLQSAGFYGRLPWHVSW